MDTRHLIAAAALLAALPSGGAATASDFPERSRETVQRSFPLSGAGAHRLEIDNVWGAIQVTTHAARSIDVSATRTTFARTEDDAAAAAREVTLELADEAGIVRAYVDGPFRDCQDGRRRARTTRRDYVVRYDFVVKVPEDVAVEVRTVNEGKIDVRGVQNGFVAENVNGPVEVVDVAGAGRAHTVNGDVRATFRRNPTGPSSFKSINGEIVVSLQPGLAADLRLKTFNGGVYTDFDVSALPPVRGRGERVDGKFVYDSDRAFAVRVGQGGPELSFDAFNGDIRILRSAR